MNRFGRAAAVVVSGVTLAAGLALGDGAALASDATPATAHPAVAVRDTGGVTAAAKHYYVKPRLKSFSIRANHTTTSKLLQTVKAPNGAWCWNQKADCGPATKGSTYRCSKNTKKYNDWIPVATSKGKKAWVARHCVYAVHQ